MNHTPAPLSIALAGCGSFGLFCLEAYSRLDVVRPVAAARASKPDARRRCEALGVDVLDSYGKLFARDDVDMVHVATPPDRHYELVTAALRAGKHVLCEKPLSLDLREAEEMVRLARQTRKVLAVNFVMRYSPVADWVSRVLRTGVLGRPLAGQLVNCGSDSGLHDDHWFWDKSSSGGIFVEHGVHFFDLYEHWLGEAEVIDAHAESREDGKEDRVFCTIRHTDGTIVEHGHQFDQISPLDRTRHRLICELGDVHVSGWVPSELVVDVAVDEDGAELLAEALPEAELSVTELFDDRFGGTIKGRGVDRSVDRRVRVTARRSEEKEAAYADDLRALLADQVAYIRDRSHERKVTEHSAVASLRTATKAAELAMRETLS
ncbi:MAG: Gfo/Idh/MocA family protein [Phycisphaerae bacterium]